LHLGHGGDRGHDVGVLLMLAASLLVALVSAQAPECVSYRAVLEWSPSVEADVTGYLLERSEDGRHWTRLATVEHDLRGAYYDRESGRFRYRDCQATAASRYRLIAVDHVGNPSPPVLVDGGVVAFRTRCL
jgi:hypothetical protein